MKPGAIDQNTGNLSVSRSELDAVIFSFHTRRRSIRLYFMRILVADRKDIHREALVYTLRRLGYEVKKVTTGNAALALMKKEKFTVALIGLFLDDTSGLRKLEQMKLMDIVPIMMTDYESNMSAREAVSKGAIDYMIKPFNPNTIQIVLEKSLEHYRLQHHAAKTESARPRLEGISECMLDAFPTAVLAINKDFLLLKYNAAAGREYRLSEKMLGQHFLNLFPDMKQSHFPYYCKSVLKNGQALIDATARFSLYKSKKGNFRHEMYPLKTEDSLEGVVLNIIPESQRAVKENIISYQQGVWPKPPQSS